MNPLLKLGLLVWLLAAASACGGDDDSPDASPTSTLVITAATSVPTLPPAAPTVTIPPTPTTAPVESTTVAATPTTAPQVSPTVPPPTAVPAGPVTLSITARNLAFDRTTIAVPANTSVTVNFSNEDTLVAHDFGVSIPFVPHTETCNGPCTARLTFNSGPPGSYTFQCSVHADMVGTFTVN
jgi:plastocyanin